MRRRPLLSLVAVAFALIGIYLTLRLIPESLLSDPTVVREWIAGFGVFAPLVFVLVQIVEVVVTPVPGTAMALLGGYLFGAIPGAVYSTIGSTIGSAIAFALTKRYGRPFVERWAPSAVLERFDGFVATAGLPGLFVMFVVPGMPDDVLSFLAGLTEIRLSTFVFLAAIGRFPQYVLVALAGSDLAGGRFVAALIVLGVLAAFSFVAYLEREPLARRLQGSSREHR